MSDQNSQVDQAVEAVSSVVKFPRSEPRVTMATFSDLYTGVRDHFLVNPDCACRCRDRAAAAAAAGLGTLLKVIGLYAALARKDPGSDSWWRCEVGLSWGRVCCSCLCLQKFS